jgi:iron(III) transport system substrate-binding protein
MTMTKPMASAMAGWALALLIAAPGHAADFTPDPVDLAAAKSEGVVSWYTSTPVADAQKLANLFTTETGIRVELFRSGGTAVLNRFMQEIAAGRVAADVLTTSDPANSAVLAGKGIFVAFKPANFDRLPAPVKDPNGYYIGQRLQLLGIGLRADKLAEADRPKSWADLTDAKYKGMEVMPNPSFTSLMLMLVGSLSQQLGWKFYEGLQKNGVMIVQSHEQTLDMLQRGERNVAAETADNYIADGRKAGFDLKFIYPSEGVLAVPSPTAVVKGSPHPNAAKVFAAWMIGDSAQALFPEVNTYATRIDMPPPAGSPKLADLKLLAIDYSRIAKYSADIKDRFDEIFQ